MNVCHYFFKPINFVNRMQQFSPKSKQLPNREWFGSIFRNVLFICFFVSFYGAIYGHNHNTSIYERYLETMTCNPPTAAQNTTINITETSARLNCSAAGSFRNFRIRANNASTWTYLAYTSSNYLDVPMLTQNSTYQWQSRLYCSGQFSGWSASESFTTVAVSSCDSPTASENSSSILTPTIVKLNCSTPGVYREFQYKKSNTSSWTNASFTSNTYRYLTGLSSGTTYNWQSKVKCANGQWSSWSATESFTTPTVCTAPTASENTTNNITSTSARLNCSTTSTHKSFRYRVSNTSSWILLSTTTANYINKTGLSSSTAYQWQCKVKCTSGQWSAWSPIESFTTAAAIPCNAPLSYDNTTTHITHHSARLNCTAPGILMEVRYRANGSSTWKTRPHTTTNYRNIYALTQSTTYTWQSRVRCSNGLWSSWSPSESFTTTANSSCIDPTASENYTSHITHLSARLNCTTTSNNKVFRHRKSTDYTWTLTYTNASFVNIVHLSPSTTYIWQSKVSCTHGQSSGWSPEETFTTPANSTCSAPTTNENTTSNITKNSARLNCSAVGFTRDYRYRKSNTSTWTTLSNAGNYKDISGLTANTLYFWQSRVTCYNHLESAWSSNESFTTLVDPTCNAPTSSQNTTSNITQNSAKLNCTTAAGYRDFRFRASNASAWTDLSSTSAYYAIISGLNPSTVYYWQSRIYCSNGQWSTWSSSEVFTTSAGTSCNAPTSSQNYTSNVTKSSARLNCSASGIYRQFTYKKSNLSTWTNIHISSGSNKDISGLSSGTSYQWKSRVYCNNGQWSAWSPIETFTTSYYFAGEQPPANASKKASSKGLEMMDRLTLSLAPNPQRVGLESTLFVKSNDTEEAVLVITDISGKIVRSEVLHLEPGANQVNLNGFDESSIYLIAVRSSSDVVTTKLIVVE